MRIDETRNLLILAGTEIELRHLIDTVDMFDIDWMSGMSAGIFTLQNADVKTIMQEFDRIVGARDQSPLAGILRVIPIERMNAILVISPNPQYLDEARKWIERLDSGSGEGVRFYVYNLQNQRAERVGPLLQQAFTGRSTRRSAPPRPPRRRARRPDRSSRRRRSCRSHIAGQRQRAAAASPPPPWAPRQVPPRARRPTPHARSPARAPASCATSRSSPTRTRTRS